MTMQLLLEQARELPKQEQFELALALLDDIDDADTSKQSVQSLSLNSSDVS